MRQAGAEVSLKVDQPAAVDRGVSQRVGGLSLRTIHVG
jgi:hypothetical protein